MGKPPAEIARIERETARRRSISDALSRIFDERTVQDIFRSMVERGALTEAQMEEIGTRLSGPPYYEGIGTRASNKIVVVGDYGPGDSSDVYNVRFLIRDALSGGMAPRAYMLGMLGPERKEAILQREQEFFRSLTEHFKHAFTRYGDCFSYSNREDGTLPCLQIHAHFFNRRPGGEESALKALREELEHFIVGKVKEACPPLSAADRVRSNRAPASGEQRL